MTIKERIVKAYNAFRGKEPTTINYIQSQPPGKVRVINDDAEYLHEHLGIIEKRAMELEDITLDAIENNMEGEGMNITTFLEEVSLNCKHINEFALCMYMYSTIRSRQPNIIAALGTLGSEGKS